MIPIPSRGQGEQRGINDVGWDGSGDRRAKVDAREREVWSGKLKEGVDGKDLVGGRTDTWVERLTLTLSHILMT